MGASDRHVPRHGRERLRLALPRFPRNGVHRRVGAPRRAVSPADCEPGLEAPRGESTAEARCADACLPLLPVEVCWGFWQ
jgi:hypothetical protein